MGNEFMEIMYVKKERLGKICLILIGLSIFIESLKSYGVDVNTILEFYYLIISLIALLLIFSNKNENNKSIFLDYAWIFFSISLFNVYSVVLKQENILGNLFYSKIEYFTMIKMIHIILGIKFVIDNLMKKRNMAKNIKAIIFFIITGMLMANINLNGKIKQLFFISVSTWILVLIRRVDRIEIIEEKVKGKINYIKFYLWINFIENIMIFSNKYIISRNNLLEWGENGIRFILCTTLFIYVVEEILNAPYNKAKGEITKNEKRVIELNNSLEIKNNEIDMRRANIKEIEQTFKGFFRNIPVPTIIINSIKGNIVYINKPGMELLGQENIGDLLGQNLMNLIDIIEDEEIRKISSKVYFAETKKTKKKIAIEYEEEKNDKGEEILLLTDLTLQIEGNNIENMIKEKKLAEEMKRKFLANISHDLKTPINVIYSSVQMQDIYIRQRDLQRLETHKNICKQNALWLRRLTNNIIDMGKIELGFLGNGVMKRENIVECVEEIFSGLIQYAREEEIEMIFDTEEEDVFVQFNREYLDRIMLNLISNAIKYNVENGKILVDIKSDKEFVYIIIENTGIGMKEEFVSKIFDRYSKESKEGRELHRSSGLGMYVVKKLVQAQQGEIKVKSEYGVGTKIIIKFSRVG
ncbi:MAG: ATP-binding protein [Romboutsia sp.]|uniref:sensor histidine kinase n=1 Tax=Romboutsia sp. TaxID=1965302 RepID=UPI003F342AE4